MSDLAVNCHVFLQANFVLKPLFADWTLDVQVKVFVRRQVIREIALA